MSPGVPDHPASTNIRHVAGVACITVAFVVWSSPISACGSAASSRVASTTVPPQISGRNNSRAAMSNESVVTASSTSDAVHPGSRAIVVSRFTRAPCVISTPLGCPVDPEV